MLIKSKQMRILLCAGLVGAVLSGCGGIQDAGTSESVAEQENAEADAKTDDDTAVGTVDKTEDEGDTNTLTDTDIEKETELADMSDTESVQLEGVSLSILGDSLSTFDGWIPAECTNFFPMDGDLTDVSETWWMQLLDNTGMELCANNSSAGSTCVGDSLLAGEVKYGCSGDRISLLTGSQGRTPDIIIVFMGTNDLLNGVPLGDNDGTKLVEEGEIDNFSDAYTLILDKILSEYPAAQVYCCGLHQVGGWGTTQPYVAVKNQLGLTAEDYSRQIRNIADHKGMSYIDLYNCGIEIDNLNQMTSDGVHYNPVGMWYVKEAVLSCLTDTWN